MKMLNILIVEDETLVAMDLEMMITKSSARGAHVPPWEDAAEEIEPVQDGVDYWLRITSGGNYEYTAETGARLEI